MSDSDSSTNLAIELSRQEAIRHGKRRRVVVDDVDVPFSAVVRQADDGQPLLTEHLFSPNAIVQSFVQGDWEILPVQSASVQQPLPEELVSSLLYDVRTQSRRTRTRVRSRSTARSSFEFRMNGSGIPADGVPHFLGLLDQCSLCSALKWAGETVSLCCMCGRVKLPPFAQHPEPLCSLFAGEHELSPHFLRPRASVQYSFHNGVLQCTHTASTWGRARKLSDLRCCAPPYWSARAFCPGVYVCVP